MELVIPARQELSACAEAYCSAYAVSPWNEAYEQEEVVQYLASYLDSDALRCYALVSDGRIAGLALGIVVPGIGGLYFRVEDFCVAASEQRRGYGCEMMQLLEEEVRKSGCTDILLGTQHGFPSHRFYLKNGFKEIKSVLLYKAL